jgi:hypothetical protein
VVRDFFGTEEVCSLIEGGDAAKAEGFPDAHARAVVTSFISGGWITLSLKGNSAHKVELERMHTVDEVWLFCFRKVQHNQWRIMGRFSRHNAFVGLTIHKRSALTGKAYEQRANDFIDLWGRTFYGSPPLRGCHWSDYVSPPARDQDEKF